MNSNEIRRRMIVKLANENKPLYNKYYEEVTGIKLGDIEEKFLVLKNEDIKNLEYELKSYLDIIIQTIKINREKQGKTATNNYIVINMDEPYINKIVDILKENNHWGK